MKTAGFTLIELTISAAVGAMILMAAYFCLSAGLSSQKMIEPRVDALQSGRVAMALITTDLRAACPLDKNFAFLGSHRLLGNADADNMDFATHAYSPKGANEGDFCEVSYFVQQDSATGLLNLWRRRNPVLAPDPLAGGRREEIAHGLNGVRFDYTDGLDWYDTWGETNSEKKSGLIAQSSANLSGMPQAVRITLSFAPAPPGPRDVGKTAGPPLVFQTVAGLELASSSALPAQSGAAASQDSQQNSSPANTPQGAGQ